MLPLSRLQLHENVASTASLTIYPPTTPAPSPPPTTLNPLPTRAARPCHRPRGLHHPQWLPPTRTPARPSFRTAMSVSTASPSRLSASRSSGASSSTSSASVGCTHPARYSQQLTSDVYSRPDRSRQVDPDQHHLRLAPHGEQGSFPAR